MDVSKTWKLYYGKNADGEKSIIIAENVTNARFLAKNAYWENSDVVCIGFSDENDMKLKARRDGASILVFTEDGEGNSILAIEKYANQIEEIGERSQYDKSCLCCAYIHTGILEEPCYKCLSKNEWLPKSESKHKIVEVKENKNMAEEVKSGLENYSVTELEAEIEKRKKEAEKEAADIYRWINSFKIGEFYKISYKNNPNRFVIIIVDQYCAEDGEDESCHMICRNVYDHDMGWIRKPHIGAHFMKSPFYTIEHLVDGYRREEM